jgi:hypothetical protein
MSEPDSKKTSADAETTERRSREQVLREIRLALAIDGLGLDERRRLVRGVDPYDSGHGGKRQDIWSARRRG